MQEANFMLVAGERELCRAQIEKSADL